MIDTKLFRFSTKCWYLISKLNGLAPFSVSKSSQKIFVTKRSIIYAIAVGIFFSFFFVKDFILVMTIGNVDPVRKLGISFKVGVTVDTVRFIPVFIWNLLIGKNTIFALNKAIYLRKIFEIKFPKQKNQSNISLNHYRLQIFTIPIPIAILAYALNLELKSLTVFSKWYYIVKFYKNILIALSNLFFHGMLFSVFYFYKMLNTQLKFDSKQIQNSLTNFKIKSNKKIKIKIFDEQIDNIETLSIFYNKLTLYLKIVMNVIIFGMLTSILVACFHFVTLVRFNKKSIASLYANC